VVAAEHPGELGLDFGIIALVLPEGVVCIEADQVDFWQIIAP
jgi:hypothetical protein